MTKGRVKAGEARRYPTEWFRDESGYTTLGAACAILAACSLAFFCAWFSRSYSRAAGVQAVADAAALAAENEVAEFVIAVRVADATLLSMSLTGLSLVGVGTICCCVPPTASAGKTLIDTGTRILEKRDDVAEAARKTLSAMQDALPAAALLQAETLVQENAEELGGNAVAYAELVPSTGEEISIGDVQSARSAAEEARDKSDQISEAAQKASEAQERADEALNEGYLHDCGNAPGYCMYERADKLAMLPSSENPMFHSVNTWSFSVALERARAYYRFRSVHETPEGESLEEQVKSALRVRFYEFASEELDKGYVCEGEGSAPDIEFPLLPSNTSEMKETSLYTEVVYPVANGNLHAWSGCPEAAGSSALGSLAQQDEGLYGVCPTCGFDAVSLGKVAAASTSIENGFEYHYEKVAKAARNYEEAAGEAFVAEHAAKEGAQGVFDKISEALGELAGSRIEAYPPGRFGALAAIAFDAEKEGDVPFVSVAQQTGSFAAVSAAVLAEDQEEDVLSSLLDGIANEVGPPLSDAAPAVLSLWNSMLEAYAAGTDGLLGAVEKLIDSIPLVGSTGLGTWASGALKDGIESAGLEPANTSSAKPFVSNTVHVAQRGDGVVARAILAAKGG